VVEVICPDPEIASAVNRQNWRGMCDESDFSRRFGSGFTDRLRRLNLKGREDHLVPTGLFIGIDALLAACTWRAGREQATPGRFALCLR
jgi:hypothetical protein